MKHVCQQWRPVVNSNCTWQTSFHWPSWLICAAVIGLALSQSIYNTIARYCQFIYKPPNCRNSHQLHSQGPAAVWENKSCDLHIGVARILSAGVHFFTTQQKLLKIDSCSGWGVHFVSCGGALTHFPCKLGLKKFFFTALGGAGAPTAPPGYAYGFAEFTNLPDIFHTKGSNTRCRDTGPSRNSNSEYTKNERYLRCGK